MSLIPVDSIDISTDILPFSVVITSINKLFKDKIIKSVYFKFISSKGIDFIKLSSIFFILNANNILFGSSSFSNLLRSSSFRFLFFSFCSNNFFSFSFNFFSFSFFFRSFFSSISFFSFSKSSLFCFSSSNSYKDVFFSTSIDTFLFICCILANKSIKNMI